LRVKPQFSLRWGGVQCWGGGEEQTGKRMTLKKMTESRSAYFKEKNVQKFLVKKKKGGGDEQKGKKGCVMCGMRTARRKGGSATGKMVQAGRKSNTPGRKNNTPRHQFHKEIYHMKNRCKKKINDKVCCMVQGQTNGRQKPQNKTTLLSGKERKQERMGQSGGNPLQGFVR